MAYIVDSRERDTTFLGPDRRKPASTFARVLFEIPGRGFFQGLLAHGSRASPLKFPRESDGEMNWCWGKIFTITEAQRVAIGAHFILRAKVYVQNNRGLWSYLAC